MVILEEMGWKDQRYVSRRGEGGYPVEGGMYVPLKWGNYPVDIGTIVPYIPSTSFYRRSK